MQRPILAAHVGAIVKSLQRRQRLRPAAPAWDALEGRWQGLAGACKKTLTLFEAGTPMNRWEVEAAGEIARVADHATPAAAWQMAVAVCLLHEAEPTRFVSEQSFRVQLGRRVRHLAETNRGTYWNPRQGRFQVVYRDPNPRAAIIIGDLLVETFGVAGTYFHRQDQAEADAKTVERAAFHAALQDVAPGVAG